MNLFQALVLGIVQGATEFFPISSSAHLKIARWFLGMGEEFPYFDLMCHAGTLCAVIWYLRRDVWEVLRSFRKMALFTLALIPLVPAYFLLKPLREMASDPHYLGYSLMVTGTLLFIASRKNERESLRPKWSDVLCIGVMQTMALIPGISRSGSTIAAARFRGWNWREAARFSFLLAIPTILGGEVLETAKIMKGAGGMDTVSFNCYAVGFLASLGIGLFAVRLIFWVYEKGKVQPFAWYCMGMGLFTWAIFRG